jgi:hypothetical protein
MISLLESRRNYKVLEAQCKEIANAIHQNTDLIQLPSSEGIPLTSQLEIAVKMSNTLKDSLFLPMTERDRERIYKRLDRVRSLWGVMHSSRDLAMYIRYYQNENETTESGSLE